MIDHKKKRVLWEIFFVYFIIFFLWMGYRIFFHFPEWFDEFVAKPVLWITPLMCLRKKILTNTMKSLRDNISYNILLGLFVGIVYFAAYTLFSRGSLRLFSFNIVQSSLTELVFQFLIAMATGFVEELVFRRYILESMLLVFKDGIISNLISAFLFTCMHLPIIIFVYKYPITATCSYLLLLTFTSLIYGWVYMKNKSLVASTITHGVWNFLGTIVR